MSTNAKETIVAVRKNGDGDITEFKTSSGKELSYEEALSAVESGNRRDISIRCIRFCKDDRVIVDLLKEAGFVRNLLLRMFIE